MDESPRVLVESARRGDSAAFGRLVRRYERTALAIAYAALGDSSAAGDAAQDAFLRCWQRLGELADVDRFGAWLARIVRNAAADQRRRRMRLVPQHEDDDRHVVDPVDRLESSERRQRINAALAELDDVTRSAVVLRYYENLSSREIAELLELTPAAVDMRLSRARAELKPKLLPVVSAGMSSPMG